MPVISRVQAYVSGYVQGVGYRAFVRRLAHQLNLTGYVRNLSDGRVEVVAEGSRDALEEMLGELRRGPYGATVENVVSEWEQATGEYYTFSVKYS